MKKNTLKEISKVIDHDSAMATIKLLLRITQPKFKKRHLNSLIEIVSWNAGFCDGEDIKFLSKITFKTEKKIEKYFNKKDLKEMSEYKHNR